MKRKERKKQSKNATIQSKELESRGVSIDMETSWTGQELTSIYSNLNNMARFQQKQLQEKEQKLLQLYDQQQQRAYQVVQRGSASSNGSNHAASISQHTVTRTTSSSHTTSTSQGGKVRQMFDERRQTSVKGIDRSYPLEPLENKLRKQPNGNGVQKNGNLTVNRQSVTVKRVARADVNSNLNGGKPVVSYHEEITRESFGPSTHQQQDDDEEFGNENHDAQYANGNHRGETHIEEVLDEDTIERNRMMAKLHLMEYDETLKHRVRNDLESEEFPEDFLVDVPDKLPKQNVTKKLSQAEIRLERFKNANARRNNNITKNSTTAPKKRSDPTFPSKSSSSKDRVVKDGTREVSPRGSGNRNKSPGNGKLKTKSVISEHTEETISDTERSVNGKTDTPWFFCRVSETSAKTHAIETKAAKKFESRRTESPEIIRKESEKLSSKSSRSVKSRTESPTYLRNEKSATTHAIDTKTPRKLSAESSKDRTRNTENPKYFCKETERSATTYAMDSGIAHPLSPELSYERKSRSASPRSLCDQTKTTANCAIDSKTAKQSPEFLKDKKLRSDSPKFFCKESEKSATTYAINSKIRPMLPDFFKNTKRATVKVESKHGKNVSNDSGIKGSMGIDTVDRDPKSPKTDVISRSPSSESLKNNTTNYAKFELKKGPKSMPTKSSSVFERLTRERSSSPQHIHRDDKKSITTKVIKNPELTTSKSSVSNKKNVKERSKSPRIFPLEDDIAITRSPKSESPDFTRTTFKKSKTNPQFFTSDSEKSATIIMVKPETIMKSKTESSGSKERKRPAKLYASKSDVNATAKPEREITEMSNAENTKHFIRSSVSRFFSEQSKKALRNSDEDARDNVQSTETDKNLHLSDSSSPLSLKYMRRPSQTRREFHQGKPEKPNRTSVDRRSRDSSPRSEKIVDNGEETREFFCYETERSATSVSLKPTAIEDDTSERSKSPISIGRNITGETARKLKSPTSNVKNTSSKNPEKFAVLKDTKMFDRRGSDNILRSTKLIREAMKRQDKKNRGNCVLERRARSSRNSPDGYNDTNGISNESKQRTTWDKEEKKESVEVNRKVDKRAGTPTARELPVAESSSKSSTSTEVDAEIQEITVADQYIKQGRLRGTYSRSSNETSRSDKRFTYSVQKPTKKRGSVFEASVFEPSIEKKQINLNKKVKHTSSSSPSPTNESVLQKRQTHGSEVWRAEVRNSHAGQLKGKRINSKQTIPDESTEDVYSNLKRNSSASSTNESIVYSPKRKAEENLLNEKSEIKIARKPTSPTQQKRSKINLKGRVSDESKNRRTPSPRVSKQAKILRSAELVRQVIKGSNFERGRLRETTPDAVVEEGQLEFARNDPTASTTIEIRESESSLASIRSDQASSAKNYERTDSVESALKRFDSIGTEADSESARSTLERSKESITKKRQTELNKTVERSGDGSKTISLKTLDRSDVNLPRRRKSKLSRTASSKTSTVSEITEPYCKASKSKTREETQGQKKCRKSKESTVIARDRKMSKKSPVCKRKLFQDADSGEETETGSLKSRNSLNSVRTVERLSLSNSSKNDTSKFMATVSKSYGFTADNVMPMIGINKKETDETSTGADRFLTVKQLRSIEDIRKSIEGESLDRDVREMSRKSAIANNEARRSSTVQATARSEHRRINIDDRAENRKVISLPARSENDALGNADRSSVKCSMRFFRVVKSPSPETTKATETGSRRRRNVQTPLSKSPDTVARRPSIELKAQDTKSTRRPTPMKGTEPIGNRKTTMTTTTTTTTTTTNTARRISTDVVDGVILENGLHLRDQTAETKYDNDSPTAKKSDAFVIDFDEQPSKENDAPLLRKPLLRKQSTEKQIPSTQSARPPSSVSSTYNGSSMQGQVSGSKGKMSSRAKTSNPNSITPKGSASSRSGSCPAAAESLVPCKICGRRFAQDRITLHEQICTKTAQKKRKQFDTMMFRVRGTDLEPFVKKGLAKKQAEKSKKPEVKSNWRRKHEDFINAIRSAKQVQAHLAAGGKLSDLPPPPVSDNCDYIQCPHCGRKFNQAAAERHIPKCEHMLHNKPIHSRAPKPRR